MDPLLLVLAVTSFVSFALYKKREVIFTKFLATLDAPPASPAIETFEISFTEIFSAQENSTAPPAYRPTPSHPTEHNERGLVLYTHSPQDPANQSWYIVLCISAAIVLYLCAALFFPSVRPRRPAWPRTLSWRFNTPQGTTAPAKAQSVEAAIPSSDSFSDSSPDSNKSTATPDSNISASRNACEECHGLGRHCRHAKWLPCLPSSLLETLTEANILLRRKSAFWAAAMRCLNQQLADGHRHLADTEVLLESATERLKARKEAPLKYIPLKMSMHRLQWEAQMTQLRDACETLPSENQLEAQEASCEASSQTEQDNMSGLEQESSGGEHETETAVELMQMDESELSVEGVNEFLQTQLNESKEQNADHSRAHQEDMARLQREILELRQTAAETTELKESKQRLEDENRSLQEQLNVEKDNAQAQCTDLNLTIKHIREREQKAAAEARKVKDTKQDLETQNLKLRNEVSSLRKQREDDIKRQRLRADESAREMNNTISDLRRRLHTVEGTAGGLREELGVEKQRASEESQRLQIDAKNGVSEYDKLLRSHKEESEALVARLTQELKDKEENVLQNSAKISDLQVEIHESSKKLDLMANKHEEAVMQARQEAKELAKREVTDAVEEQASRMQNEWCSKVAALEQQAEKQSAYIFDLERSAAAVLSTCPGMQRCVICEGLMYDSNCPKPECNVALLNLGNANWNMPGSSNDGISLNNDIDFNNWDTSGPSNGGNTLNNDVSFDFGNMSTTLNAGNVPNNGTNFDVGNMSTTFNAGKKLDNKMDVEDWSSLDDLNEMVEDTLAQAGSQDASGDTNMDSGAMDLQMDGGEDRASNADQRESEVGSGMISGLTDGLAPQPETSVSSSAPLAPGSNQTQASPTTTSLASSPQTDDPPAKCEGCDLDIVGEAEPGDLCEQCALQQYEA